MFTTQQSARDSIIPAAGRRVSSRLLNGVQGHAVQLDISGTLTIAGADAASIRNRGSLWAAVDEVGIVENGSDSASVWGPVLRALSEEAAPSALSSVRLTAKAQAAYSLKESARIYFAHPYALQPRETAYMERDTRQVLEAFVRLAASGGGDKIAKAGAGGTVTLSNVQVDVTHIYDGFETQHPYFIPHIIQSVEPVAGANARLAHYIKTPNMLRSIMVSQVDSIDGEVSDVINTLRLRGDAVDWIDTVKWANLVQGTEFDFGGASGWASGAAHLGINFQKFGRLASVMNPGQDTNLRLELDVQPSATGSGSSSVLVTRVELWQVAGLTQPVPFAV